MPSFPVRVHRLLHREVGRVLFTRRVKMRNPVPLISFTFDDFPRSAADTAASILDEFKVHATYYASLGLMGQEQPPLGDMFTEEDLAAVLAAGHEVACHTFGHNHSRDTKPDDFEQSIIRNRDAMKRLFPEVSLRAFSFPFAHPLVGIKRRAARHFQCCRTGGQTFNKGVVDLNLLNGYFLEQSGGSLGSGKGWGSTNLDAVKQIIDQNRAAGGWLLLGTHDVRNNASQYGCTPSFFRDVVREAVNSGARVLPVSTAREVVEGSPGDDAR